MIERRTTSRIRVCVAIPTFRRPAQLESLLRGISRQEISSTYDIDVVVFDNDSSASAAPVVESLRPVLGIQLIYVHERERGLSAVRNSALAFAEGSYEFLAMIDDDENPEPQWLAQLLEVATRTRADATFGPVRYEFPDGAPRWLKNGNFFDLPVEAGDGEPMVTGYSGNCLLRVDSLRRFALKFDRTFDFSGGEDLLFFRQLHERGASFVFAARAQTTEGVVPKRASAGYILKLNYRRGNTLAICDVRTRPGVRSVALRALKGSLRLARGFTQLIPLSLLRGRGGALTAACDLAHGIGSIVGLFGVVYEAYGRVDVRA